MSKTRQRFMEKKKAKREARAYDKWWREHTFWCLNCKFEVRFRYATEGSQAVCRRCKTQHIFGAPMTSMGAGRARWMTVAVYGESVLGPESVETVELANGKEVRLVDHAQWCSDKSRPLYGCKGVWQGPGKIAWYMSGRRGVWHLCQSSAAAQYVRSYGRQ